MFSFTVGEEPLADVTEVHHEVEPSTASQDDDQQQHKLGDVLHGFILN